MEQVNFLFCDNPLNHMQVDEDYIEEYEEAHKNHKCALFSYENLQAGRLTLAGDNISGATIYRGWMMKPEMYESFYGKLKSQGIFLINTPDEYRRYHLLLGWYEDFKDVTAESFWTLGDNLSDVMNLAKSLSGSFVVKDYVKSRKHEWSDACFIPDIQDTDEVRRIVENFIKRQDDSFVGGVVLRRFIPLQNTGIHPQSGMPLSDEYRVFVFNGEVITIDRYWSDETQRRLSTDEFRWVQDLAKRIRSHFVSMDIARRQNGQLIVMELGDGQVSGLQQLAPESFYQAITVSENQKPEAYKPQE